MAKEKKNAEAVAEFQTAPAIELVGLQPIFVSF